MTDSGDPRRHAAQDLARAQRELERDPGRGSAWLAAGQAMLVLGHEDDARVAFEQAVRLAPERAEGHLKLGLIHARAGRSPQAEACYRAALARSPKLTEAWLRLGTTIFRQGRIREAEAPLRQALDLDPGLWPAAVALSTVLERSRRVEAARELLAPLVAAPRPEPTVAMTWAGLCLRLREPERALPAVEAALATAPAGLDRGLLLHAHGDLLDALGRWEQAFMAYSEGNRGRGHRFDAAAHAARVEQLVAAYSPEALAAAPRASQTSATPVLVVGMPRSGTSVLEQALGCHPAMAVAGELDTLRRVGMRLSEHLGAPGQWFQQPARASAALLDAGAQAYLEALCRGRAGATRITDKMPDNHLQLGLAALMLPGARVIHLRRDPVDTCWSCFRQPFGPGLAWSCDLGDLGAYYTAYRRIMAHWARVAPLPTLELRYEELVAEPEPTLRRVLDFLELPWEPACLQFHRSERLVVTASHAQVQEPLHNRAVGRATPYHPWLGGLIEAIHAADRAWEEG